MNITPVPTALANFADRHILGSSLGAKQASGARPMHPDWLRGLRDQVHTAGAKLFVKQIGGEWGRLRAASCSCVVAGGQSETRQQQLAVLGVAQRQITGHEQRRNAAKASDDRARFVEPPRMGIARSQSAV
jgi:Protein of unknown function (DUF5131)